MLYENYQKKVLNRAKKLAKFLRVLPAIILTVVPTTVVAVALVATATIALLTSWGNLSELTCNPEVTYGESVQCEATAFLSNVWYEYSEDGDVWSEEYPKMPGEYQVRAVSHASFGEKKYSKPKSFTIAKRSLTVSVANQSIVYGESLSITADVAKGDVLVCDRFVTEDAWLATGVADSGSGGDFATSRDPATDEKVFTITPDKSSIKILDAHGNDVTGAYDIDCVTTEIALKSRQLYIETQNVTKVYDGEEIRGGEYVISDGSLKEGDEIIATFNCSIVNVGAVSNIPDMKIVNENGVDVSGYYAIMLDVGVLMVEPRPLKINFADDTLVYAGDLWYEKGDYNISADTPLIDGHYIVCSGGTQISDCGRYENSVDVDIYDSKGNNVTENYLLDIDRGTITVTPRPLTIITGSHEWLYDSVEHYDIDYTQEGLVDGHSIKIMDYATVKNVGEVENNFDLIIFNREKNVTQNYDITFSCGTLSVTPRKLHISTHDGSWIYDGRFHTHGEYDKTGDEILSHQMVTVVNSARIKNVGTAENTFAIEIFDGRDRYNVTSNYEITYSYGTLEITPRYLHVTTLDGHWVYDGEYHENHAFDMSGHGILYEQTCRVFDASSIRDAGSVENILTIKIFGDYTEGENYDASSNYIISYDYGTLTVEKRQVSLSTESASWTYDGQEHYSHGYYATSFFGIVDGEELEISGWDSITNVGFIPNAFDSYRVIRTESGVSEDITDLNYIIDWTYGTLQIYPRPIVCKPVDESKVYDDTPLVPTAGEIALDVSEYDLVEGHYLKVGLSGSITDVGLEESFLTNVRVFDSEDNDVTFNYQISTIPGILEVTPRRITVYTGSASKPQYDGLPLTCGEYGVYPNKQYDLVEGHTIHARVIGSQTEVGESVNVCDEERTYIRSGERDVTDNYEIQYEYGTLSVKCLAVIYVTSASDWKYWDGTPLTNDGYEYVIQEGELDVAGGHRLVVNVTGSITELGTVSNTISVYVVDDYGYDVSNCYKIVTVEGILEIREKNDTPLDMVVGQIKTESGGYIYLRQHSYGNYNGKGWNSAIEYAWTLPGGYGYNYLPSIALANMGQYPYLAEMKGMLLYMLPYHLGFDGDYERQGSDTVYNGSMEDFITSYYILPNADSGYDFLKGNLGEYAQYEEQYRKLVYDYYLSIDDETLEFMKNIISEQKFDASDPLVIQKVASYIQTAAKYNLEYNHDMDIEENVVIAFLEKYKEGICVHYASSATLLYRALNIPARYVEGFTVMTVAGEFVDITAPGHAWVEVYIDGFGWIPVEVTGASDNGSGGGGSGGGGSGDGEFSEDEKKTIVIKPAYQYKIFDYEPLIASNKLEFDEVLSELLGKGYSYQITVTGSQTEVGVGISTVVEFVLFDSNNVDVTEDYNIQLEDGVLMVLPAEKTLIRVYLYQLQKFYDGTPLTFEDGDYEIIDIPDGFELELYLDISLTNAGQITLSEINEEFDKYVSYRVYRYGVDVTENCSLVFESFGSSEYVPIRVDKRPITITSASETKVEDGAPLENGSCSITVGTLVEGHNISVIVDGFIDYVGSEENSIESVTVTDADGTDVTDNYQITTNPGELTIISKDD